MDVPHSLNKKSFYFPDISFQDFEKRYLCERRRIWWHEILNIILRRKMTEEEDKKEKENKENKRPDLSKLETCSGWECSVDTGSC